MAFGDVWDELTPDGDVNRGFDVDDLMKELKRAIRQRLEGEAAEPGSGLFDDWAVTAKIKPGGARAFFALFADIATAFAEDGRLFIATDRKQLFHKAAAADEVLGPRMLGGFATLPEQPRARVSHSVNQAVASGTGTTVLDWDGEDFDVGDLHDNVTNNSRITIPTDGDGIWIFGVTVQWASDATGQRRARFFKNGSAVAHGIVTLQAAPTAGQTTDIMTIIIDEAVAGDFYEAAAGQDSGGSLDVLSSGSRFWAVKLW